MLVACVWAIYAWSFVHRAIRFQRIVDVQLFGFFTLVAVLTLLRRPARTVGPAWDGLLGFAGTVMPVLMLRPGGSGWTIPSEVLQGLGVVLMVAAAVSLGRSFGVTPADRGLRTTGLYGVVRHPLYAAELLFFVGYLLGHPSWRNAVGLGLVVAVQVARIFREERILAGYASYAALVRWRLIPHVW
ncbi:MAG: hypothetical protein K6W08_08455 [Firmicutes bacterium]|nr:hypothetical protein [Bacillota bacterium]